VILPVNSIFSGPNCGRKFYCGDILGSPQNTLRGHFSLFCCFWARTTEKNTNFVFHLSRRRREHSEGDLARRPWRGA